MVNLFKNNIDQKCPACKQIIKKPNADYPTMLCENCIKLVTDKAYQKIGFKNNSYGGVNAFYLDGQGNFDTSRSYSENVCCVMIGGYNVNCQVEWAKSTRIGELDQIYIYTL